MDVQTKEALITEINNFKKEALKMHIVEVLANTYERSSLFDYNIDSDGSVIWYKAQARQLWDFWQVAKAQVPEWISVKDQLPPEGIEVLVHSLGQVQQATRDSSWSGGFKVRNCYGWQAAYGQSHWMPKSIKLPESFNFYYENDAKNKAMIEAQEQSND